MRWLLLVLSLSACATGAPRRPPRHTTAARHRRRPRAIAPPRPGSPSASSNCAPLIASSQAVLRRAFAADLAGALVRWPVLSSFGHCTDAGRGVWGLRLDAVREQRVEGALELEGSWSLVFSSGSLTVGIHPWSEGALGPEINLQCAAGDECLAIDPLVAFDHDGDGVAEVSLVVNRLRYGVAPVVASGHGRLWALRDGQIDRYGPARDLIVTAHRDEDGDGRPDLLTYGPYTAEAPGPCGRGAWPVHGPALMAHGLPDGQFSLTDAAARAALQRACSAAVPAGQGSGEAYRATMASGARAVACARLQGTDALAALRALHTAARAVSSRCRRGAPDDWDVVGEWARTPPWITFR